MTAEERDVVELQGMAGRGIGQRGQGRRALEAGPDEAAFLLRTLSPDPLVDDLARRNGEPGELHAERVDEPLFDAQGSRIRDVSILRFDDPLSQLFSHRRCHCHLPSVWR